MKENRCTIFPSFCVFDQKKKKKQENFSIVKKISERYHILSYKFITEYCITIRSRNVNILRINKGRKGRGLYVYVGPVSFFLDLLTVSQGLKLVWIYLIVYVLEYLMQEYNSVSYIEI